MNFRLLGSECCDRSASNLFRILLCFAGLALLSGGCTTKSSANAKARAAFIAGQQEAAMRMQMQTANPTVSVAGPVRHPVQPWTPGLTLSQAIINAGYTGRQPSRILIVRSGRAITIDPKKLLEGDDMPLEIGDIVQINQ
jgi:hypothetical protein